MPTLTAILAASVAGWFVEDLVRAVAGPVASIVVSLIVSAVAFFFAKRILTDLRG